METIDKGVPFVVDTREVLPEENVGVMDIQKEREAFINEIKKREDFLQLTAREIDLMLWAWQAAKAQAVPEGFVLVPKEPTGAMVKAGSWNDYAHSLPDNHVVEIYKLMIQAAQEPSHD